MASNLVLGIAITVVGICGLYFALYSFLEF